LWELFSVPGVSLATSYYSDVPTQHEEITGRRGSHAKTRANIVEAIRREIPLRVGVIDLGDEQRWQQAVAELEALGVTAIGYDRLRQVGRGIRDAAGHEPVVRELRQRCRSDLTYGRGVAVRVHTLDALRKRAGASLG
ncbi:MAG: hypothetical protein ACRDT0_04605, partial [Pseudonocardiaceae bacterium]